MNLTSELNVAGRARATHTTLEARSLEHSLRTYRELLGLSTAQHYDKVGLIHAANGHFVAVIEVPKPVPQPFWNYYARPVPRADVDPLFERVAAVSDAYELRELRKPQLLNAFGVATYGFALCDRDGNWWRIEEDDGPFGRIPGPRYDAWESIVPPGPIGYVTLESADLAATATFHRDFLGLAPVARDGALYLGNLSAAVNVIIVPADGEPQPQTQLNHHGLTLPAGDVAGVDEAYAAARTHAEMFGLRKILPITHQHGSYSFYLQDRDTNWWEIEILDDGLDPWERVNRPPGDEALLDRRRGRNTVRHPFSLDSGGTDA